MNVIYDPETDTLSIIFRKTKVSESDELREGIIIRLWTRRQDRFHGNP